MRAHEPANRTSGTGSATRLGIAVLALLGLGDALYMLAYHEGMSSSLICPFFGGSCDVVGRSKHARHFGVPNAAVGALVYAAMIALALWPDDKPPKRRAWQPFGLAFVSLAAGAASIFLTWEQAARVRAWCFWCLLSVGVNMMILPMAMSEAWRAARLLPHRPARRAADVPPA